MRKNRRLLHNVLFYSVFVFYIVLMILTLFRTRHPTRRLNLVPFYTIWSYLFSGDRTLRAFALSNVLGNIALFVPLGVYWMVFRRGKGARRCALQILGVSLAIEVVQYLSRTGIGDIDDVILNTLGGFLGILLYRAMLSRIGSADKVRIAVGLLAPVGVIACLLFLYLYNA